MKNPKGSGVSEKVDDVTTECSPPPLRGTDGLTHSDSKKKAGILSGQFPQSSPKNHKKTLTYQTWVTALTRPCHI